MPNRMRNVTSRTLLLRLLVAVGICAGAAGCVSMPSAGPVLPYGVTPTAAGQQQPNPQFIPQPPGENWSPEEIVQGFLEASASFVGQQQVAREYLTPTASRAWQPSGQAIVFKVGPSVQPPRYTSSTPSAAASSRTAAPGTPSPKATPTSKRSAAPDAATVIVGGTVQAKLAKSGAYAVASASPQGSSSYAYDLVMHGGQWRISNTHGNPLLLTTPEFAADYQLRNLYFLDPSGQHLVPDSVYVPQATQEDVMNGLVQDLISQPTDWLASGATHTAFPRKTTQLGSVVVEGGTAAVNLGGAAAQASDTVKEQISAQLLYTLLSQPQGQQVKSVALSFDGKAFSPGTQQNPVQNLGEATYKPVLGSGGDYYYVDQSGELIHQHMLASGATGAQVRLAHIGTGYKALAVSPDGDIAALSGGQVYTGQPGARSLTLRATGGGVTSLSWDYNDELWIANMTGVYMLTASAKPNTPPVLVDIRGDGCASPAEQITEFRVAPDGVQVAVVYGGLDPTLAFGAIVNQGSGQPGRSRPNLTVNLSPFCVYPEVGASFQAVSWYGPDDVIALAEPGDKLAEYPVNGATPTPIQPRQDMQSITASGSSLGLIASTSDGALYLAPTVAGAWNQVAPGKLPAYPG